MNKNTVDFSKNITPIEFIREMYGNTAEDGTLYCAYHCHSINSSNFKPRMFCLNTAEFVKSDNGADILKINGPFSTEN